VRGMFYRLESSTDLLNFTPLMPEERVGDATFETVVNPVINNALFLRVTRFTEPQP